MGNSIDPIDLQLAKLLAVSPKAAIVMRHPVTRAKDPPERALAPSLAIEAFATPGFAEVAEGLEEEGGEKRTLQAGKIASPESRGL